MPENITIQKNPQLPQSMDYAVLRELGMKYIEDLGNKFWTDYNIHDPGITLLELFCYAITDLGYRTSLDIKDLLAPAPGEKADYNRQGFFTAREILTVNPWTTRDYRKLLIDIDGIKNAWLFCKECPCDEMYLYASCAKSILQYTPATEHQIIIKGLYDVLIEFEDEEGIGDLNSGKIKYNFSFATDVMNTVFAIATIEMRLPSWHNVEADKPKYKSFRNPLSKVTGVTVRFISGNKGDNLDIPQSELGRALRRPIFASLDIEFLPDAADETLTEVLQLDDVPFLVGFSSDAERKAIQLADLKFAIADASASGIIVKYLDKIKKGDQVIAETRLVLHGHRNLCEDYCTIKAIEVEDIAICADMDVTPDADIEKVMAQAYYLISQYFSPDIKFYALKELMDSGVTVDDIFDGPALNNGFINNDQLALTQLKKVLHTSDIINLLMDIPGVVAVRNLVLVKYDEEGNRIESQSWTMNVSYNHQPRLYIEGSKFLVFKNGLPFLPDRLELADTLQVIKGIHSQPQYSVLENDLRVPEGNWYPLNDYQPVQNSLPLTYGVGYEGLPPHATQQRRAQAKQLKAYLLFFEQAFVNYLSQISHLKDLFALDTTVAHSYFSTLLDDTQISDVSGLYATVDGSVLTQATLDKLAESNTTFLDRRNRFLDHQMARFAEQFTDYALMLYSYTGSKQVADEILIKDKISFLKDLPFMSRNRTRAHNYKDPAPVCSNENIAGLKKRIERLLGFKQAENHFEYYEESDIDNKLYERRWRLKDENGKLYLSGTTRYYDMDFDAAQEKAAKEIREVLKYMANPAMYEVRQIKKWVINLRDPAGEIIATRKQVFETEAEAMVVRDEIVAFAKKLIAAEKIFIVEHLLLRPRNKPGVDFPDGDPLLSICLSPDCSVCGEEDPYSFRLTIVMNGEEGLANEGIAFRRFAENTIRLETPAHLGLKVCWVSTAQLEVFEQLYCDWSAELTKQEPDAIVLHLKLVALLNEFKQLKSVYPKASLHDCADGNDENRVYLNQTIV
jgi:hypothetical protein